MRAHTHISQKIVSSSSSFLSSLLATHNTCQGQLRKPRHIRHAMYVNHVVLQQQSQRGISILKHVATHNRPFKTKTNGNYSVQTTGTNLQHKRQHERTTSSTPKHTIHEQERRFRGNSDHCVLTSKVHKYAHTDDFDQIKTNDTWQFTANPPSPSGQETQPYAFLQRFSWTRLPSTHRLYLSRQRNVSCPQFVS